MFFPNASVSFQKVSEPNSRIYQKVFDRLLTNKTEKSEELSDWFLKYKLNLSDLKISLSSKPTQNVSCFNTENSFLRMLDKTSSDYGKGIILLNQDKHFGIIKGVGQLAQFFSAYNIVNDDGEILALRGGIYRFQKEIYSRINKVDLNNRKFKILQVNDLALSLDRIILEDNFSYTSNIVSENFDKVLLNSSGYLKNNEGNYELIH